MKCLVCKTNQAVNNPTFGVLPCTACQTKHSRTQIAEIVPDRIKQDRKAHFDDTIQPFRKGVLSKEYIKKYGTKNINVTEKEVKSARNVWDGYYNE